MAETKTNNILIRVTTVSISLEKLLGGQMYFMNAQGFEVYMVSSPGDNIENLQKKESSKFLPVPMSRTISPFKDLIALIKLICIFNKLKPDIVHTHTPKAGLLGTLAAWITRVPVRLHSVAGLPLMEEYGMKRVLLNWVERLTYFCATKVYPNSNNLKQFILDSGFCKEKKVKVIGNGSSNGIDTEYFKSTPELTLAATSLKLKFNIKENDFVYIFVGRLVKDKGIEELIIAFSNLNEIYKNVKLLLVGSAEPELDPLSVGCMDVISQNPNIISVGYQSDIRAYLAMSNALVFPSYREGFPNVPMQSGCFDLPSIVTNINGCNEIIVNRFNGLIIPVKNVSALQNAMEQILVEKELYKTMASNARSMIVERYEQERIWKLILSEYKQHLKFGNFVS
jgi:glycosyltransferase involved in cell wall biosynthesis